MRRGRAATRQTMMDLCCEPQFGRSRQVWDHARRIGVSGGRGSRCDSSAHEPVHTRGHGEPSAWCRGAYTWRSCTRTPIRGSTRSISRTWRGRSAPPARSSRPVAEVSPRLAVQELLSTLREGDYVAIQAYVDPTAATEELLRRLRLTIRDRYGVATTVGDRPAIPPLDGTTPQGRT